MISACSLECLSFPKSMEVSMKVNSYMICCKSRAVSYNSSTTRPSSDYCIIFSDFLDILCSSVIRQTGIGGALACPQHTMV